MAITVDTTHALWVPDEYLAKRAEPSSSSDPKTESKHIIKTGVILNLNIYFIS